MSTPLRRTWLPTLLWLAVIALESSSLGSAERTGKILLALLTFFFGKISFVTYSHVHYGLRKAGHFIGYAVLSLMMFRAWWATLTIRSGDTVLPSWGDMLRRWTARAAVLALLSTVAVASLDEWHQTMLANRTGNLGDVLLDSFAALFMQLVLIVFSNVRTTRRNRH